MTVLTDSVMCYIFIFYRPFPVSRLGFAVNLSCIMKQSKALLGYKPDSHNRSSAGLEESDFLRNFLVDSLDPRLECRGSSAEVSIEICCMHIILHGSSGEVSVEMCCMHNVYA